MKVKRYNSKSLLIVLFIFIFGGFLILLFRERTNKDLSGNHSFQIDSGGLKREYFVISPKQKINNPLPLVIALHGGGGPLGTAQLMMERSGWRLKAEKEGFLVVFPQGTLDNPNKPINLSNDPTDNEINLRTWSEGSGISGASQKNVDDVGFIKAVIDDLERKFNVDKKRIFVTGFSNGATMSYHLGIELSDLLAAIAPIAGLMYTDKKSLVKPVSLINIVGDMDRPSAKRQMTVNIQNLENRQISVNKKISKEAQFPAPVYGREYVWRQFLNCPVKNETVTQTNGIRQVTYGPCMGGSMIINYTIGKLGHVYPGLSSLFGADTSIGDKINATDVVWQFFKKIVKE